MNRPAANTRRILVVGALKDEWGVWEALDRMDVAVDAVPVDAATERDSAPAHIVLLAAPAQDLVRLCSALAWSARSRVVPIVEEPDLALITELGAAGASDFLPVPAGSEALEARLRLNLPAPPPHDTASDLRLRLALEGTRTGLWDWKVQTGEVLYNDRWAEMLGYTLDELQPVSIETWKALCHPEDLKRAEALLERCFSGDSEEYDMEVRMRHRDGRWITVLGRGKVVEWSEDGVPLRMIGTHVDVTDWKKAEAALEERSQLFRAAAENAGEPMLVIDGAGRVMDFNDAACQHLKYTPDEMARLTLADFDEQVAAAQGDPDYHTGTFGESPGHFETVQVRKDGTRVPVEVRVTPVHFRGEKALLGFIRDLTARRRAEALAEARLRLTEASLTSSSADLLRLFLDEAEQLTESVIGFFHFVDEDQEHIHLQQWSTHTLEHMCEAEGAGLHYPVSQAGVWAECIRTGLPAIHNDYPSLEHKDGLPEGHAPLLRELVVPVLGEGRIVALLGVGNKASDYGQADVEVLSNLAREGWEVVLRKQAQEQALQEAERYHQAVSSSPDGFWAADLEGNIVDVNGAYCRLVGYAREEVLGMKIWDLTVAPEDEIRRRLLRAQEEGVVRFPSVHRHKDGRALEVEVSARYVSVGSGRVYTFIRDATERNRLVAELRQGKRDYSALVENSPDVIMRFDEEGRHLFVSGRVRDWGLPPPEAFVGKTHREMGFPEELCREWEELISLAVAGQPQETETSFQGEDGTRVINWRLVPEGVDEDGRRTVLSLSRDITEARRLERDYRNLFEEMLDGFALHEILCDDAGEPVDYRFLAVNPAFEALTGLKAGDVVGRTVKDVMPATEDLWIQRYGRVALTGEPAYFEGLSGALGKVFNVAAYQPAPRQFATIFVDVTEHRKLAQDHKELFSHMGEGMAVCELLHDADGDPVDYRFLVANPALGQILDRPLSEVVGKRATEVLAEEEVRSAPIFARVLETGEAHDFEAYRDSIAKHLHVSAYSVGPDQFAIMVTDITARRQAETALKESEARLRGVFDHAPLGIFLVDPSGTIMAANPALATLLLRRQDQLVGLSWEAITHPDHIEGCRQLVDQVMAGKATTTELEKRYLKVDGQPVWARARVAPIRNGDGGVDFLSILVEDLTQEREAEAQRAEMETRLRQAQKMEAIGTLAGGIAHDFNNILGAILGYSELAVEDAADPHMVRKDLAEVVKAGNRARDLVGQILAFSRQGEQERRPLRLAPVVKEAVKLLRASIPSTIEIGTRIDPDTCTVLADATQVHQVLMNLCTNAYHAMRSTGGRLDVRLGYQVLDGKDRDLSTDLAPGRYAVLEVSDDGPGMDQEILSHIFEPYFTTKEQGEGTGLGLAIVHGIVLSHGGTIRATSSPGAGALFRVYLPTTEGALTEHVPAARRAKPRGTERVLFVDDERAICDVAEEGLSRMGYNVLATVDPQNALNLVRQDPSRFDVLITDLTMPKVTGIELIRGLRQIRPDLPVILCSGYAEAHHLAQATAEGVGAVLTKPLTADDLGGEIRRLVDARAPAGGGATL